MRPCYKKVIDELELLKLLAEFDPIVIGTPPLGIATDESDIDIACSSQDFARFAEVVVGAFGKMESFSLRTIDHLPEPATVASFCAMGWELELFCQSVPTKNQWGVRHYVVEARLLELRPNLRKQILKLKQQGLKTEPAFATALSLSGDPYIALLDLEGLEVEEVVGIIDAS